LIRGTAANRLVSGYFVREAHAAGASYGSETDRESRSNLAADWEGWGRKFQFVNGLKPGQLT